MKLSQVSGIYIYEKIEKLKKESSELYTALGNIEDSIGRDSIAYKLLKANHAEKQSELAIAERTTYTC